MIGGPISMQQIAEAAGIVAAAAVLLATGLCIWANNEFKQGGLPDDDDGDA